MSSSDYIVSLCLSLKDEKGSDKNIFYSSTQQMLANVLVPTVSDALLECHLGEDLSFFVLNRKRG